MCWSFSSRGHGSDIYRAFVSVRVIRELLSKVLPERTFIDRHMINNVNICARQSKRELLNTNIEIYPKHFDTSFIDTYKKTSDNYTEGMYIFVVL